MYSVCTVALERLLDALPDRSLDDCSTIRRSSLNLRGSFRFLGKHGERVRERLALQRPKLAKVESVEDAPGVP